MACTWRRLRLRWFRLESTLPVNYISSLPNNMYKMQTCDPEEPVRFFPRHQEIFGLIRSARIRQVQEDIMRGAVNSALFSMIVTMQGWRGASICGCWHAPHGTPSILIGEIYSEIVFATLFSSQIDHRCHRHRLFLVGCTYAIFTKPCATNRDK